MHSVSDATDAEPVIKSCNTIRLEGFLVNVDQTIELPLTTPFSRPDITADQIGLGRVQGERASNKTKGRMMRTAFCGGLDISSQACVCIVQGVRKETS